jgi:hypothetical protein
MRYRFVFAAALAAPAAAIAAGPADFTCTNRAAQIACTSANCEVETQGFTPMSVSRSGNRLEVCAYSGCWSGPLDLVRTRGDLVILHARLAGGHGQATVSYDRKAGIATMLWGNFAQGLSCGEAQ